MLSERLLSAAVRRVAGRNLRLLPFGEPRLPEPVPGREYFLYVHVPFCTRLCPYCTFHRFPFDRGRATEYFRRLRGEMRQIAEQGYQCTAMYVGGGTPTVVVDELVKIIRLAKSLFPIREVSAETNPDHLTPEVVDRLTGLVDRLSVGVQSFDDAMLRQMERYDKYGSGEETLERIRRVAGHFDSFNVDMIFNLPTQTEEMLLRDVEIIKAAGANQATFYPLMVSAEVEAWFRRASGRVDYTREARYYELLCSALGECFEPATCWTFSRTGGGMIDEYIVDYEDYVGIGSGAFSVLDGTFFVNTFSLAEYSERIDAGLSAAVSTHRFPLRERMRYRFLMGLFGLALDKRRFAEAFGVEVERGLPVEMAFMRAVGAFSVDDRERLELTPKGRYLLVAMMREFFVCVNSVRDRSRTGLPEEERAMLVGGVGRAAGEGWRRGSP